MGITMNNEENNIDIEKRNRILKNFIRTFQEFLTDIKNSYPEHKKTIEENYNLDINNVDLNLIIIEHFMMSINPYLIQISNKDETIFTEEKEKIVILKNINFNEIWLKSNKANKEIIWKYLHTLVLLGNNYNATIRKEGVFEQFNEMLSHNQLDDSSLNQISEQAKAMLNMVKSLSQENDREQNQENGETSEDIPGNGMFENTKIGEIAKELASEINFDDFSKNLGNLGEEEGQDPMKLMGLIQNVGSKIQDKISSGQINEKELVDEAQNMMKGLQDNPLFKGMNGEGIESVFGSASNGLASNLFGGGDDNNDDLDDLDKDLNKENSESSSFNPDNIRKMGFNSIFSKLGGGGGNNNSENPMGNIGDMMSQMMSDPGMQQMAQQMHQNNNNPMGNMNDMMSQMMNNQNIQQMAQRMAGNPNMQQMAQQMAGNPNMQQMAQQMAQNNSNPNVRVDNNKLRNMGARERLRKKLEDRKKKS